MFKPMLAGKLGEDVKFPALVSPKLDGIRCVIIDGVAYSRNLKPIPNRHIAEKLKGFPAFDGELIVGAATGADVWNRSNSGVMARDGEPDFRLFVFDWFDRDGPFIQRLEAAERAVEMLGYEHLVITPHYEVGNHPELSILEERFVSQGYEGAMLRDPMGPYKHGRSTTKEGWLLKLKRFEDYEATIVGVVEQMHNGNEATRDELGRTKRSTAAAGKTGKGTLGALKCELGSKDFVEFELGTGFDDATRAALWANPPIGKSATFKCQGFTPDGKPRFPVFKGIRGEADLPGA